MKKLQDDLLANKVPAPPLSAQPSRHVSFSHRLSVFPPSGPADSGAGEAAAGAGPAEVTARRLLLQVGGHPHLTHDGQHSDSSWNKMIICTKPSEQTVSVALNPSEYNKTV